MFGSNRDLVFSQVPFALVQHLKIYAIIEMHFGFGSNRDLVNSRVPFAFHIVVPDLHERALRDRGSFYLRSEVLSQRFFNFTVISQFYSLLKVDASIIVCP